MQLPWQLDVAVPNATASDLLRLVLCCVLQALSAAYMVWRAARSCPGGWMYFYSIPVLLAELAMALMANLFLLSLWRQIERPSSWLGDMLPVAEFPAVDVYIACYTGER
jgi:hypothetical protein